MFDTTQILLTAVVAVLTVLLSIIGIQVFFILREVQKSLQRVNKMLDDFGTITESIARPIGALSSSITNASGVAGLLGWLVKRKKKREKNE